ncbi:MAG: 1-acyl-sn-glycerol-3-phosphate acyltransferase, partial [Treponema sp.]|nr:1-acyl-sn-glycerol-3-phosphate acyltransferase [Treponema sp.]
TVKLPVAVCALDGGWKLSHIGMMLQNLKKGAYRVKVLKVFDVPQTKEDEKRILAEAPALIQAQLDEWRKSE